MPKRNITNVIVIELVQVTVVLKQEILIFMFYATIRVNTFCQTFYIVYNTWTYIYRFRIVRFKTYSAAYFIRFINNNNNYNNINNYYN